MLKIQIPTPLRQYAGKQAAVEVKGSTVAEALNSLVRLHPDLKRHLYTDDGKLRAFVNVYVNDEDIRYLEKEATQLKENDNISIVPSIAGGSREAGMNSRSARTLIRQMICPTVCCPACCCCQ
ncbi:MAG: MoaD/ThiS family protein [Acidobacteria bacterium]|nr:MoaD/ThiS family protein [Acidobacteriota bacterium]MBV9483174.1 MoaD/ThiS family protein [Acidobacteriota bacterium]